MKLDHYTSQFVIVSLRVSYNAGSERKFLVSRESRQICEVLKWSDEPRSWFIGDSVQTGIILWDQVTLIIIGTPQ